jgi:membrane-bound serine protease (ClpP class)
VRRLLVPALLACLAAGGATPGSATAASSRPLVIAIKLNSEINPVSASFVSDEIDRATSQHAAALVILMDTPGGDQTSMNKIVQDELASPVPVIVYVSPPGGRAASAGSVITMGSDLAAMAPATHIGAATPIDSSGQNIGSDLRRKILNDAEKQMQSLAESHGRNATLAVEIVSHAREFTNTEALRQNLIEAVAPSLPVLLTRIDGMTTTYTPKPIVLHTAGASIETVDMPWTLQLLNILIDPNLLYLLFLAGLGGIAYEVFHPGVILPGTLGAVSLILALFGFSIVSINWAGAVLIAFGVALLLLEAFVTSHGLIGLSGVIAICAGGLMLFRAPGQAGVSPVLVIVIGALFGLTLALVATKVVAARHQPVSKYGGGASALLGLTGVARTPLSPNGQVFVHGELWRAQADAQVQAGEPVVVQSVEGLLLHVEPTTLPPEGLDT